MLFMPKERGQSITERVFNVDSSSQEKRWGIHGIARFTIVPRLCDFGDKVSIDVSNFPGATFAWVNQKKRLEIVITSASEDKLSEKVRKRIRRLADGLASQANEGQLAAVITPEVKGIDLTMYPRQRCGEEPAYKADLKLVSKQS